ncbi:GNAT family N-acetyltransferase [Streptomyces lavendulae]|uniref:GNAT family N-acetyltransferase n=1 Tax=Streptomyces lavendulae TaxID=1914 RepID=UPI0036CA2B57
MLETSPRAEGGNSYSAHITDHRQWVEAAQRLRYRVFAEEMGATLDSAFPGRDTDTFDAGMDHLIVSDTATAEVVGTYRLLPPGRTDHSYADGEFDLRPLGGLRSSMLEMGRSCVHPDHRTGAVIGLMWSTLYRHALFLGLRYLAGCASVPLSDGGRAAVSTWMLGKSRHWSPPDLRVRPRRAWVPPKVTVQQPRYTDVPPLLRGYLRMGAWLCGPPAYDPAFDAADFFVLLDLGRVSDRHRRHYIGEAP